MVFLIVLAVFAFLFLLSTLIIYFFVFYTPVKNQNDVMRPMSGPNYAKYSKETNDLIKELLAKKCEMVYIKSRDGLKLEARYYESENKDTPIAICAHGYRGTSIRDFCGGSKLLSSLDMSLLLISERGCMGSEGHTVTFGVKEKNDILDWVEYVKKRKRENASIYLMGVSMGAHTVLTVASSLSGNNVRGIIADCPYTSSLSIIESVMAKKHFPHWLFYPLVKASSSIWGAFHLTREGAVESVRNTSIPILIIHGTKDNLVPYTMSEEIYNANEDIVKLVEVEGADHALSYMVDNKLYIESVKEFVSSTR